MVVANDYSSVCECRMVEGEVTTRLILGTERANSPTDNQFLRSLSAVQCMCIAHPVVPFIAMQRLLGSFVLISMLNPEPILSTTNVLDNDLQTKDNANLSLRNERKIVGALAFLFALTDDPTKVSALCLERDAQQSACVIRVAMNTGVPQSYLISFSKIARALEDLARSGE